MTPAIHTKLDATMHTKSHQFSLLLPNLFDSIPCYQCHTIFFLMMSSEADQSSNAAGEIPVVGNESVAAVGSEAPSSISSSTMADQTMARKEIPHLYEY
jgi:hypothetical protein